jgi:hypothetical protein
MKHSTNWYLDFDGEKIADHYTWNVDESVPKLSLEATFRRMRRDLDRQATQFANPLADVNFTRAVEKTVALARGSFVRHLAPLHPCSFAQFIAHPTVDYVLSEIAPPSARASYNQVAVTAQQLYHFAARHRYQRVYQVTDNLGQRLEATDLRGLRGADMRLPHPAIQIFLPQSTTLQFHNHLTGLHRLHSVYLIEHYGNAENHRVWRMLLVGVAKGRDMAETKEPDDALLFFDLDFFDDEPIEEAVARERQKLADYVAKASWLSADIKRSYQDGTWIRIFNYIRNVVLYTTASDVRSILAPEVAALKARMQRKKSRNDPQLAARWRSLGRRVILGHDMEPLERSYTHRQVLVSGHFRNQPCGPQRSQRKRIFLEPYWRNLDAEEAPITQTRL